MSPKPLQAVLAMKTPMVRIRSYAVRSRPFPTSLTDSWKLCSVRRKPPKKKHSPRHRSIVDNIEPRIAAWMT